MANIQELRQKYPQYNDMSDVQFADAFHGKFYSDIPKDQFYSKIGFSTAPQADPGFTERIGQAYDKRIGNMQEYAQKAVDKKITKPEAYTDFALQPMGFVSDVSGEALKSIGSSLSYITPKPVKELGKGVLSALGDTHVGRTAAAAVGEATAGYNQLEENFPRTMRMVSDVANLGGVVAGVKPAARAIETGADMVGRGSKAVAQKTASAAKNLVTPSIPPEKAQLIALAKKHGINLGIDDLTDSKFYKTLISEGETIPFSNAAPKRALQHKQFTKAVAKSIGLDDVDDLRPENMAKAYEQIGKQFDDLTKGQTFQIKDVAPQIDEIKQLADDYAFGPDSQKLLDQHFRHLGVHIGQDGVVKGEDLAKFRARMNNLSRNAGDPNVKALGKRLEELASDFITDSAPEPLKKAKYQYKNFLAIEPLAQKAQVDGMISPALLNQRTSSIYKRSHTLGNAGELGELSQIGQLIKEQVPNSGTSQRSLARTLLTGGTGAGLGVGVYAATPLAAALTAAGAGGGMAVNRMLQASNYSPDKLTRALMLGAKNKELSPATAQALSQLLMNP